MSPASEPVIDALAEVWSSIEQATKGVASDAWDLPTDCPGWSVRDNVSHLIGIERTLLGEPQPAPVEEPGPHVRNPFGAINEAWVAERRGRPGLEVAAEWHAVAARRLDDLRERSEAAFDKVGPSPLGEVPYRRFMWLRVMDSWVHEQDIRNALGRPGGQGGAGERQTLDHVASLMPYVVGRKVRPEEGDSVVFDVRGDLARTVAVEMHEGRGRSLEAPPGKPTVRLVLDATAFWRLGCGRGDPAELARQVSVEGDRTLGAQVVAEMNFMI